MRKKEPRLFGFLFLFPIFASYLPSGGKLTPSKVDSIMYREQRPHFPSSAAHALPYPTPQTSEKKIVAKQNQDF